MEKHRLKGVAMLAAEEKADPSYIRGQERPLKGRAWGENNREVRKGPATNSCDKGEERGSGS